MTIEYYTCRKCGSELILDEENFHHNKRLPGGFDHICKVCRNEYTMQYRKFPKGEYRPRIMVDNGFDMACWIDRFHRPTKPISIYKDAF